MVRRTARVTSHALLSRHTRWPLTLFPPRAGRWSELSGDAQRGAGAGAGGRPLEQEWQQASLSAAGQEARGTHFGLPDADALGPGGCEKVWRLRRDQAEDGKGTCHQDGRDEQ